MLVDIGLDYLTVLDDGRKDRELDWEWPNWELPWRLVYFLFRKFMQLLSQ